MAGEISASLRDEFPVVLSVMGGAAVFTGRLLPLLGFPLEFGAIEVTRYNNDTQGRDIAWRLAPRDNVRERTVLVVDDILDEGITLAAIRARLLEMGAKRVLARRARRQGPRPRQARACRLRRRDSAQPLRFRIRDGCLRALAQPAGNLCA